MLDMLRQSDDRHNGDGETPTVPPPAGEDFVSDFANEEVPFIEVGPARSLEASPAVLAAAPPPRLRIAPQPPPDAGPVLDAPAGPPVGACLRPLPGDPTMLPPAQRFARDLIAFHQPDHPAGAEYRQLAASLAEGARPGHARVLLCAGVAPGAGTTSVVLNLAVCLAGAEGLRVVVVDADDVRPAVAERLGLRGRPGLAEVLDGSESLEKALQETGYEGLAALTAGRAERERSAFPVGDVCRPVLRQLRDRFDVVLIDGGSDDGDLGRACDAAYLVVPHAEAEAPPTAERVRALLRQGAPLRGCIVTGHQER
jgi:Mrp family chromosome partitioning ATPase